MNLSELHDWHQDTVRNYDPNVVKVKKKRKVVIGPELFDGVQGG